MSLLSGIGLGHHRTHSGSDAVVLAYGHQFVAACKRGHNAQGEQVYASMDQTTEPGPVRRAPVKGTAGLMLAYAKAGRLRSYSSAGEAQKQAQITCRALQELDFYI